MLVLMLIACANARADANPEIDDPVQIKAFSSDPRVDHCNYPESKNWKKDRRYIQIGVTSPNGACQFHDETGAPGSEDRNCGRACGMPVVDDAKARPIRRRGATSSNFNVNCTSRQKTRSCLRPALAGRC